MNYFRFFLFDRDRLLEEHYDVLPIEWTEEQIKVRLDGWVRTALARLPAGQFSYGWERKPPPDAWKAQEIVKLETQALACLERIEELKKWRQ